MVLFEEVILLSQTLKLSHLVVKVITNRSSSSEMFLKISQYSQENTFVGVSF